MVGCAVIVAVGTGPGACAGSELVHPLVRTAARHTRSAIILIVAMYADKLPAAINLCKKNWCKKRL